MNRVEYFNESYNTSRVGDLIAFERRETTDENGYPCEESIAVVEDLETNLTYRVPISVF